MKNKNHPKKWWRLNSTQVAIFVVAVILWGLSWWYQLSQLTFNPVVLNLLTGFVLMNFLLTLAVNYKSKIFGYVFGIGAIMATLVTIMLLFMSQRGAI